MNDNNGFKNSSDAAKKSDALELGSAVSPRMDSANTPMLASSSKGDWNTFIISAGLVCALSSFTYGYNISDIGGVTGIFQNCTETIINETSPNGLPSCVIVGDYWNLVVAAFCVGGLIGALATGRLTDRFGRKIILIVHNAFYISGAAFMTFATHLGMLIAGRFLIGLGSGICTVVVPMYLGEIAPDRIRGQLGTMHQAAIVIGILVSQLLSVPLLTADWRVLFGLSGIPSVIQMALLPFYPESPKYMAAKGRTEDATRALRKLRGHDNVDDEIALWMNKSSKDTAAEMIYNELQLIRLPEARVSLLIGIVFHAAQQLSGINTLFYFTEALFNTFTINPKWIAVCIGVFNLFMTGVSIWLIDRQGRRPLILTSSASMCISGALMTLAYTFDWSVALLIFILMFVGSFAIGLGPVPWVITADIFPANALNAGVSYCIGTNWIFNTVVALTTLELKKALNNLLFVPFAVIIAVFFVFAFITFRETKNTPVGFLRFR